MALGERFQSGGARGIARFLSDHQHCDGGFDVQREQGPGSGRLLITCLGCGEAIAYRAAEAGELAAGPAIGNGEVTAGAAEPALAAAPPTMASKPRSFRLGGAEDGSGGSRLLPAVLVGGLILAGAALIGIGIARSGEDDSAAGSQPAPSAAQGDPPALEAPPPAAQAPDPEPAPDPAPPAAEAPPPPAQPSLNRREFAGLFTLGVPAGWREGGGEAVTIAPGGGKAEVRVFYERGERSPRSLVGGAAGFLEDEHPGARVGRPRAVRVGGVAGTRVSATYPGGTESAVVLADAGYTFLILTRADRSASKQVAADARAAASSFRAAR